MPNDTAITRLLYAILSQKCLKDIDWNKVALDPILSQEITNGHAARMRYSRFKKQMENNTPNHNPAASSAGIRKPRTRKPAAGKVEKKSSSSSHRTDDKVKARKRSLGERVKEEFERGGESFNSQGTFGSQNTASSSAREMQTPDPEESMLSSAGGGGVGMVKSEPGAQRQYHPYQHQQQQMQLPTTPLTSFSTPTYSRAYLCEEGSPSSGVSFGVGSGGAGMEEMFTSFGSPSGGMSGSGNGYHGGGGGVLYGEMMAGSPGGGVYGHGGYGMYGGEGLWGHHHHSQQREEEERRGFDARDERNEGSVEKEREREGVMVKSEERWGESYGSGGV